MAESADHSDRRAQKVAGIGLILQAVACGAMWILSYWAKSDAIAVVARFMLVGIPVWLILFLVQKQMRRVAHEALETAELKRARKAGSDDALFELDDEALLLEQNRLRWMVKWLLPATTIIAATLLIGGNFIGWSWSLDTAFDADGLNRTQHPTMVMWFVVSIAFISFLYARYSIALAQIPQWRLIRAGATAMAGNAFACTLLAATLMAGGTIEWAEPLLAYALRCFLVVLGIEFLMNFILDLYRPRTPGEIARPSFDSRLLGLITEPGGIAKSIADAANYQFGFEVSKTWFYALLQRWMLPISAVTAFVVLALTSIVIIEAEEQVVIERFGCRVQGDGEALEPGLRLKWPFPIDVVHRASVRRVDELVIGEATEEETDELEAILWSHQHAFVPELMLVVASSKEQIAGDADDVGALAGDDSESVPVSLLKVSVPIEYRIKDIHDYLYGYDDPVKLLENVAYQYLSDYAAGVDIDQLMGPGRSAFNEDLGRLIQDRLDQLGVGIEIVFVGIHGAHPPVDNKVAAAFQGVIEAETKMGAVINAADGLAKSTLTRVAGTETRARVLDAAIRQREQVYKDAAATDEDRIAADEAVNDLLVGNTAKGIAPLSGRAAAIVADAKVDARRRETVAANKARAFATEVAAFEAAPELYKERKIIEAYSELGYVRRYLIAGDASNVIVEYVTEEEASLDKVLAEGVEKQRKRGR